MSFNHSKEKPPIFIINVNFSSSSSPPKCCKYQMFKINANHICMNVATVLNNMTALLKYVLFAVINPCCKDYYELWSSGLRSRKMTSHVCTTGFLHAGKWEKSVLKNNWHGSPKHRGQFMVDPTDYCPTGIHLGFLKICYIFVKMCFLSVSKLHSVPAVCCSSVTSLIIYTDICMDTVNSFMAVKSDWLHIPLTFC